MDENQKEVIHYCRNEILKLINNLLANDPKGESESTRKAIEKLQEAGFWLGHAVYQNERLP